jgi:hypothetical protein
VTEAERKKLEEELKWLRRQLAESEARLTGAPQGSAVRESWKARSRQIQTQIDHIEAKLKAG